MKLKTKLLLILGLSLSLPSCKFDHTYYFRNFSPNKVILLFHNNSSDGINPREYFYYKNEIVKINKNTEEKLTDTIHFTRMDPDHVSITVPPHSTIRVNPLGFNRDEILIAKPSQVINNSSAYMIVDTFTSLKARYTGGVLGLVRPYGYYDYKE